MSGELYARSPSESTYLAKLKLLSFQGLICVTPMEGLGGGLMRHKMMINEFIGRCSSNKDWRAPVRTSGLSEALNTAGALHTAGVLPRRIQHLQGLPFAPSPGPGRFPFQSHLLLISLIFGVWAPAIPPSQQAAGSSVGLGGAGGTPVAAGSEVDSTPPVF